MDKTYKVIDLNNWARKSEYDYFMASGCSYNISFCIDISKVRQLAHKYELSLYLLLVAITSKAVNEISEFHYSYVGTSLVNYRILHPVFYDRTRSNNVKCLSCEYNEDIIGLAISMDKIRKEYNNDENYIPVPLPDNCVIISMVPWQEINSVSFSLQYVYNYLLPIITFFKYKITDEKVIIPVSIVCNHRVIDGSHVCSLIATINKLIENIIL
jgi:chloramphenicol O-acetyltransferase type A